MKREIPILFSTPMVKAILEGRKTMTRRIVKFPSDYDGAEVWPNGEFGLKYSSTMMGETVQRLFPRWQKGDILYVRERWAPIISDEGEFMGVYHSTDDDLWNGPWKPSIHLQKRWCRIWLEVTDVRSEQLHSITPHEAMWEGLQENGEPFIERFQSLWQQINGNWDESPWVWVISFKVLSTSGKPSNL